VLLLGKNQKTKHKAHHIFLFKPIYLLFVVYYFSDKRGDYIYELTSVLLHLGNSAQSGHYISHIRDEQTGQWWKFNDSQVTLLDPREVGDKTPEFDQQETRRTRDKVGDFISNFTERALSSQNAYMLIYVRKDRPVIPDPDPPLSAQSIVQANNAGFMSLVSLKILISLQQIFFILFIIFYLG
jgi:hypothetical protein